MKQEVTIGVVCLARATFDYRAAAEIYKGIIKDLEAIPAVRFEFITSLVIEVEDARRAAKTLSALDIDGLVIISGTFHLGHLTLELNRALGRPLLLWGLEELPYDGGKIRLNSICGVNLDASNLYKAGVKGYHVCVGNRIDTDWIDAVRVLRAFRDARLGLAGFRAHGFFNLGVRDLDLYAETGILLEHYELADIFGAAAGAPAEEADRRTRQFRELFDTSGVTDAQVGSAGRLAAGLDAFVKSRGLTALAVRCWPEFAADYGISPCAAMSLLQSENAILACEGDVEGALSMTAHRAAGAGAPFLFDFSQVDFAGNYALFWHCGVAPCNLWDGRSTRSLDTYFAGGRGVTADFVLGEGDVSVLRLDSADGGVRVFLQRARSVPMEKELRGTYFKAVFDRPVREVFDLVTGNGIAHHASVVYGDYIRPFEILAKIKGWTVIS